MTSDRIYAAIPEALSRAALYFAPAEGRKSPSNTIQATGFCPMCGAKWGAHSGDGRTGEGYGRPGYDDGGRI